MVESEIAILPQGRHQEVGLTAEDTLEMYYRMVLTRVLDQRVWMLNRQGKVAIVGSCQGHEAAAIGSVWAMDRERDLFFIFYRSLPVAIALGVSPREAMLAYMAKEGEPFSGGRQFPLHGAYPRYRILNLSNVVGSQVPHAVGAALAAKMRREPTVVITYFGDGATSQGEWHEALNFAGIHRLPVIFLCENNRYAISVPLHKQMAIKDVAERARSYGFPGIVVDGSDIFAVYQATRQAAQRARSGEGPTLIEAKVERLMPHTSDDDDRRYRPREEVEAARKWDPLPRLRRYLMDAGLLTEEQDRLYHQKALQEVNDATEFAEKAPFPDPTTLLHHLYASTPGEEARHAHQDGH